MGSYPVTEKPCVLDPDKNATAARTGDIVLFSGTGFESSIVKWGTKSPWSHVGLLICSPAFSDVLSRANLKYSDPTDLYMLHSYPDDSLGTNVLLHYLKARGDENFVKRLATGVQMIRWTDVRENYRGFIYVRPLRENAIMHGSAKSYDPFLFVSDAKETRQNYETWINWIKCVAPRPYEKDYWSMAASEVDNPWLPMFKNETDTSSYFCSELTRDALAQLFPAECEYMKGEICSEWTPKDFAPGAQNRHKEPRVCIDKYWRDCLFLIKQ